VRVPLADLPARLRPLRAEIDAAIAACLDEGRFLRGVEAARFEEEYAAFLGVRHVVACSSGTDALYLALRSLDIGPGDEVILPANGFIATAAAVVLTGATPVFADIDPASDNLDPAAVSPLVGRRTRAVLAVHLRGNPADMPALRAICGERGLALVADAAHAHGATLHGRDVASLADLTTYSFNPTKNLGAFGHAGGVATDRPDLARRVARLSDHGREGKNVHLEAGANMRIDELQAAVLRVQLRYLPAWTARRREMAARYRRRLGGLPLGFVEPSEGAVGVYHQFVVDLEDRDGLAAQLAAAGVSTAVHYPVPVPLTPAFSALGVTAEDIPVAVFRARRILTLPVAPELTEAQHEDVCAEIGRWFGRGVRHQ
jgi:dTDP-4-amino-4,6-dideoxygalactose transaminase